MMYQIWIIFSFSFVVIFNVIFNEDLAFKNRF